ncbi:uncharacterized protein GGS22DRAFT_155519 [Annulohypoxylon maeteangense]|uniref:uncharacterized protein n=1 Tax=Annulohypoxylon maeteangense TaxID=1927788 RepID=UPI0020076C50|nr:uncharacterized protein GGS22DRAFT_155519 [Annulohypoxylon maeteangense]KAI0888289.1 hypothetical protein GGS22DRAFT_155519 [Annulohypoxylon maeteangense]
MFTSFGPSSAQYGNVIFKNDINPNSRQRVATRDGKEAKTSSDVAQSSSQHARDHLTINTAIFTPLEGNYLHWSLVIHDCDAQEADAWHIWEVAQEHPFAPYKANYIRVDPTRETRFRHLVRMGTVPRGRLNEIQAAVRAADAAEEERAAQWNCQDYVFEVWENIWRDGLVTEETYYAARDELLDYYGPGASGPGEDGDENEAEENEEERDEEAEKPRRILSEEFVYDSDE